MGYSGRDCPVSEMVAGRCWISGTGGSLREKCIDRTVVCPVSEGVGQLLERPEIVIFEQRLRMPNEGIDSLGRQVFHRIQKRERLPEDLRNFPGLNLTNFFDQ